MIRRGSRMRETHHGLGLLLAGGALLIVLTGLALQHPGWLGRGALAPRAVAADPADPERLLRASAALLEESRDGGRTWADLPLLAAPDLPVALAFAPAGVPEVWLLGTSVLLRSDDGGRVWEPVALPAAVGPQEPPLSLAVAGAGRPVLATAHGAWLLADGGGQWQELWRFEPTRGDRLRAWARRLHTGHWGAPAVARIYDVAAFLFVVVVVSGLVLGWRRRRRRRRP